MADSVPLSRASILTQSFPASTPSGAKPIDQAVLIAADPKLLPGGPRGVNLRMLAAQRRGEEGRYALNRYLRERGDAKLKPSKTCLQLRRFSATAKFSKPPSARRPRP